jgi:hypothetical protein
MLFDAFSERLASILGTTPEYLQYQRWLDAHPRDTGAGRDYLFSEPRARFEPRKQDVVVALAGLEVTQQGSGSCLRCAKPTVEVKIADVGPRDARSLLQSIDGQRCLLEVLWESGVGAETLSRFLRASFGLIVFAPAAVNDLESRLPGVQIVRFPCAPYAIERPYWDNMVSVRERLRERVDVLDPFDSLSNFIALLRELHVLALMGRSLTSFYRPASPGADQCVAPGALLLAEPRWLRTSEKAIFLDGPRVNVSLLGGEGYHHAVAESLEDRLALADAREFSDEGLSWGRFMLARAEKDEREAPWFCPPRPITQEHFEVLRSELMRAAAAADSQRPDVVVDSVARFHQAFVRLHPFHCANQSVAMNIVNTLLERSHGAGIPHLLLDLLALRLSTDAYIRLFRRAVRCYAVVEPEPLARLTTLRERYGRFAALIQKLSGKPSATHVRSVLDADPDATRWALIQD